MSRLILGLILFITVIGNLCCPSFITKLDLTTPGEYITLADLDNDSNDNDDEDEKFENFIETDFYYTGQLHYLPVALTSIPICTFIPEALCAFILKLFVPPSR